MRTTGAFADIAVVGDVARRRSRSSGLRRAPAFLALVAFMVAACSAPEEPAPWWKSVDDACALAAESIVREAVGLSTHGAIGDAALWSTTTPCPSAGDMRIGADAASVEDVVLVRARDGSDLVGAVLEGRSSTASGAPVPRTLAVVDARTGAVAACVPLPFEHAQVARPLLASSDPPRIVVGLRTKGTPGAPAQLGFVAHDVDARTTTTSLHDVPGAQGRELGTSAALLPNGELALTWRGVRVASFSIERRALTFTAGLDEDDVTLLRVFPRGSAELLLRYGGASPHFARVDRCGTLAPIPDSGAWLAPPMPMRGAVATWEASGATRVVRIARDDGSFTSVPCTGLAQLAADRLACLQVDARGGAHVAFLDADGAQVRAPLASASGALATDWQSGIVATRSGVVLATALVTYADRVVRRLVAVAPSGDVRVLAEVLRTDPVVGAYAALPPLLTDDGVVILAAWGTLTAVQTDTGGLALTDLPRGPLLGGNGNAGPVDVR